LVSGIRIIETEPPPIGAVGALVSIGWRRMRRWLIEPRRIGPVIRALRRYTDPLFRQAGINLDDQAEPMHTMHDAVTLIVFVALALAIGACSTDKPCAGPFGEPCGGPRSGWPGAATCPSC
jgi:hypothetical protein